MQLWALISRSCAPFAAIAAPYITCWKGFPTMLRLPAGSSQKPVSSIKGASFRAVKGGRGVL
jgi:hypothetical protein